MINVVLETLLSSINEALSEGRCSSVGRSVCVAKLESPIISFIKTK